MPLKIFFHDSDLLVVDKPSGQSVHNAEDPANLLKQIKSEMKIAEPHPVLAERFQSREVGKRYVGLLRGVDPGKCWRLERSAHRQGGGA